MEVTIHIGKSGAFDIIVDRVIVGGGCLMLAENKDDFTYLERIDIRPEHQRKGYGTQALLQLKEQLGNYYLSPDNEDAKRLYKRLGCEISSKDYNEFGFAIDQGYGVYVI